jgi:hypothetical protein
VAKEVEALMPAMYSDFEAWVQGGCVGVPPASTMTLINSTTHAPPNMVTPAATIPDGRGADYLQVMPEWGSTPSISYTPVRAGPSTLAELDAIMVIT